MGSLLRYLDTVEVKDMRRLQSIKSLREKYLSNGIDQNRYGWYCEHFVLGMFVISDSPVTLDIHSLRVPSSSLANSPV
jgi:hypothetical protein